MNEITELADAIRRERPKPDAEFDEALLDVFEAVLSPDTSGVDKAVAVARFREAAMALNLRQTRRYLRDAEIVG